MIVYYYVTRQITTPIPRGHRLAQVPSSRAMCVKFVEVPQVIPDEEVDKSMQSFDRRDIMTEEVPVPDGGITTSRDEMVSRVSRSGYIRPR